jgi:hypothetical protein
MKERQMAALMTDYRAGFTYGLITGAASGTMVLGSILFLVKFWLPL